MGTEAVQSIVLELNIERLWKGTKSFERLKFIELNNSLKLIETPDITEVPVLEKLILEDCIKLCCSKLVDNQGFIDMFLAVIKKILQGHSFAIRYEMVIPGSEIPKWFCHQTNGEYIYPPIGTRVAKVSSDHLWFLYLFPEFFGEEDLIKLLWGCDENGFIKIGIDIRARDFEVKKWGLRMVYKKDIEDHNQTMAQSSNNNIIPYKGLDVFRHNFVNLAVVAKGSKAKRSRDDYDGTTPSGEGSSDDIPHPKRIERVPEFMALGNSDCEESSELMGFEKWVQILWAYLVEKGYWLLHARHCRTQAGSSVIRLTDTTLSEDPELWNQAIWPGSIFPLKLISLSLTTGIRGNLENIKVANSLDTKKSLSSSRLNKSRPLKSVPILYNISLNGSKSRPLESFPILYEF
nr:hypothetical protein CFP56_57986 [Quercus suber]